MQVYLGKYTVYVYVCVQVQIAVVFMIDATKGLFLNKCFDYFKRFLYLEVRITGQRDIEPVILTVREVVRSILIRNLFFIVVISNWELRIDLLPTNFYAAYNSTDTHLA